MKSAYQSLSLNYGDLDKTIEMLKNLILKYESSENKSNAKAQERVNQYKSEIEFLKNIK